MLPFSCWGQFEEFCLGKLSSVIVKLLLRDGLFHLWILRWYHFSDHLKFKTWHNNGFHLYKSEIFTLQVYHPRQNHLPLTQTLIKLNFIDQYSYISVVDIKQVPLEVKTGLGLKNFPQQLFPSNPESNWMSKLQGNVFSINRWQIMLPH